MDSMINEVITMGKGGCGQIRSEVKLLQLQDKSDMLLAQAYLIYLRTLTVWIFTK